jgi:hypothetical protein
LAQVVQAALEVQMVERMQIAMVLLAVLLVSAHYSAFQAAVAEHVSLEVLVAALLALHNLLVTEVVVAIALVHVPMVALVGPTYLAHLLLLVMAHNLRLATAQVVVAVAHQVILSMVAPVQTVSV